MSQSIVIVQKLGLFDTRADFEKATKKLGLPKVKLDSSTVAIVHSLKREGDSAVKQYSDLIFAQPNEVGLKLQDGVLLATPFTSHPLGNSKKAELLVGQTARFEWRRRIDRVNIMTHMIINVGLSERSYSPSTFLSEPDLHIVLEIT